MARHACIQCTFFRGEICVVCLNKRGCGNEHRVNPLTYVDRAYNGEKFAPTETAVGYITRLHKEIEKQSKGKKNGNDEEIDEEEK